MNNDEVVLCASSVYTKKYYLNPEFSQLPQGIRDELQIMCVMITEDVGGELQLIFDEAGNLNFRASAKEDDLLFDEIGSVLKVKQQQAQKRELLEGLETYYKVRFLGLPFEEEEDKCC